MPILANVKSFSRRLEASPAKEKIFLLLSDLLENSDTVSFYRGGRMRTIDPKAELEVAKGAQLMSDLSATKVYIIGAGLIPRGSNDYRSREELRALETFWNDYFTASGATSVRVGTPTLLEPIA